MPVFWAKTPQISLYFGQNNANLLKTFCLYKWWEIMKRDIQKWLSNWKNSSDRKPLLLRGARQVGKSWLMRELGKEFEFFIECNFEENPDLYEFFKKNLDPNELVVNLANYLGKDIIPEKTFLFFDEVQAAPRVITSLRYFYEKMPELHVAAAGSLLEFELERIGIPVGRVQLIHIYPMSFGEFLTALGNEKLRMQIKNNAMAPLPEVIHNKLMERVRDYCIVGGMPEIVQAYVGSGDLRKCQQLLSGLVEIYRKDFNKYAKKNKVEHLKLIFEAVPRMLGNKFIFRRISENIKSVELAKAVNLLEMAGIVYKVYHSKSNGVPLGSQINPQKFKVIFFDIGLAQNIMGIDIRSMLVNTDIMQVNEGSLTELFVGLEIINYSDFCKSPDIYYWHREAKSSNAEIDYVISRNGNVIPIEVKNGKTGSLKSLNIFLAEKKNKMGFQISAKQFNDCVPLKSVPLYGIESWLENFNYSPE